MTRKPTWRVMSSAGSVTKKGRAVVPSLFLLSLAVAAPQVTAEILGPALPDDAASDDQPSLGLLSAWLADGISLIAALYLFSGLRRVLAGWLILRAGRFGQRKNAL